MKKRNIFLITIIIGITAFTSCGLKCAKCHVDIMGVKTPDKEYCGDSLKRVKELPNVVCDDK